MAEHIFQGKNLRDARIYLTGPMDWTPQRREEEKSMGWRTRMTHFLWRFGAVVFDPWHKPPILGMPDYDREGSSIHPLKREEWTYEDSPAGNRTRAEICEFYKPTVHVDFRMVDISDFLIARCPTTVYSVGTPSEIALARTQHKPVLLVTPPASFPALEGLRTALAGNATHAALLEECLREMGVVPNEGAIPSLWYMGVLDGTYFFDGFGFREYMAEFPQWKESPLDAIEERHPPQRPLLPFLVALNERITPRFDLHTGTEVPNDDWLMMQCESAATRLTIAPTSAPARAGVSSRGYRLPVPG